MGCPPPVGGSQDRTNESEMATVDGTFPGAATATVVGEAVVVDADVVGDVVVEATVVAGSVVVEVSVVVAVVVLLLPPGAGGGSWVKASSPS